MSQKFLIETLNAIKQISIQIVQQHVNQENEQQIYQQITDIEKKVIQEYQDSQIESQIEDQKDDTKQSQQNVNNIQIYQFNQTKQYLKNILKRVNITHVTHLLQNKVIEQKNEKKSFLNELLEQSIIFSWYNILLQQGKVKDFFKICIQQKNPEFEEEIENIFKINLLKIIQNKDTSELNDINKQLVELGKKLLKQQSQQIQEKMIHFEQICLKVVQNEEIDQLQLNSIPLQYFLRYAIQLIVTSFDIFCRLYLIYNDDQNQIKVKNLWINKKLAFENDFPIFIHIKKEKVYYYLCLKIKLTENELEEKLANLKRNSHALNQKKQSPVKQQFQNSDSTKKNIYRDNYFPIKQPKRKSNYQIRFEQKKKINDKFQNNIYDDLERIDVNQNKTTEQKDNYILYKTQEDDFPTSKLNILKNSIKNQINTQQEESQRSKTVQNKKFNKSIIDLKINNFDVNKDKKLQKSKKKKMQKQLENNTKNGIFSYRRTNDSIDAKKVDKNTSKEKTLNKIDDYILKPNISKLIKKSNKFKSIREENKQTLDTIQQNSNTSLENKSNQKSFFETFENFDQQIDKQLYEFNKNDQILSLCVRKQIKPPSIENNRFLKKYNLKTNKGLQYRQNSETHQYHKQDFFKGKSPLLDFRKQNTSNNYPSIDYLTKLTPQNSTTQNNINL